ncbi:hypothetical protein NWP17_06210 [Chrysosporum bergii ANA360D]|uniref:Uncharacterized protein n=1 Tax=Chrysosporum bergii ANA360D TaxID=617107 RepID=A0AA43GSD7_9CYAN|nr:hypothetical protein [Chrysosporum bergii]MDH6060032.1 hypothetical protein [Chrysosporum bergii ANA360D]
MTSWYYALFRGDVVLSIYILSESAIARILSTAFPGEKFVLQEKLRLCQGQNKLTTLPALV